MLAYVDWRASSNDPTWDERFCEADAKLVDEGHALIFLAFDVGSNDYVGRIDLHSVDFEVPRGEIGFVGDARRAGRGLMREAALAVVALGFRLGLARIQALCDCRNDRAIRFAEALGFTREGVLRCYERDGRGELCDQVVLAACRPPR